MKRYKRGDMIYLSQDHAPMMLLENERLSSLGERTADVYVTTSKTIFKDIRLDWCRRILRKPRSRMVKVRAMAGYQDGFLYADTEVVRRNNGDFNCHIVFNRKHLKGGKS